MGQEVRFGRHRFDPPAGRLWVGRREVRLTRRAADVLAALVDRAGQPVTREELFRSVWRDTVVGDAALTACIQELRRALGDDARRPRFIETRHRRGYRFVARMAPPAAGGASPSPHGGGTPPVAIIGRDQEMEELRQCLARAMNGDRQIVFVTGEPGIGKTAAVEAFLQQNAVRERLRVARGRCVETHGAGEAYLPLLEALTRLCREPGGQPIVRALRHHAPTWLAQMPSVLSPSKLGRVEGRRPSVTPGRMLRELAEAVEVVAEDVPLILWLEDLHWSDPSTVDWLAYAARRPGPARVLVLATYRPGEARTGGTSLEATKDDLEVHGYCREVALGGLSEIAVGEYLARRFPPATLTDLAAVIHRRTAGNPLFVVSVADDLGRRGLLVQREGRWEVTGRLHDLRIGIPDDVRRMIGHELDRVPLHQRAILEAASAAGLEFSAATVSAAAQRDLEQVEQCCAELAAHAWFLTSRGTDVWPDGTVASRYAFRHAVHQEVVYERISPGRKIELHRRIGDRLETGLGRRASEVATELAMHFERGRDTSRAIRYLSVAGQIATERRAAREAVGHLTRALDLLGAEPDGPERSEEEVLLQIALGGPLMAMKGRGAPAVERLYTRAQELCERLGPSPRLFPVLWGLFLFRRSRGEIDAAHGIARRVFALARRGDDSGLTIQAHHALWATLFARGELAGTRRHVAQALALYDPGRHAALAAVFGNHDPAVCALGHGAWASELSGEPEQATAQSERAVALARALGHPFSEAHALLYAARLDQFRGDWQGTRDRAETAAGVAREQGFVQLEAWATMMGGWARAAAGDVEAGLAAMRDGTAAVRALGSAEFETYFQGLLAETLARAGRPDEALGVVAEALAFAETSGERFYAAELHRSKGQLLRDTGHDPAAVARCFETAIEIAQRQGARALERRAVASFGTMRDAEAPGRARRRVGAVIDSRRRSR